ncbi:MULTISPECIES: permease-like cell division protein FtsX [Clostridium]|uniref:Cell division protein FtsX n=1 Tax=Clostridium botulinum (strain Eklund 17B / Type B) TaxID=935198 RepID=B2TQT1_CLOBB|nr:MULTISPECIES: permease-like cell division protein FtsX [Clostridium]ACD22614.1 efflux ABC transporter, permease protein, FtsX family [Clostridium botulinum B str. Eklund 17B (NRP)]MBY6975714.1 ABC transporter permease [Clostridium botulinum]MBY7001263.1 ABC transporter permease [Clostridium botulinum]MCR1274030.1 permease-like cell division protein FtsX [Clostridium botulinum]NFD69207.1 ABC transporter permease [Clostridium botulinum]
MRINTFTYFIKDAFTSLKRNRTISFASILTVLITFFVLGIFILLAGNVNQAISSVQDKVDLEVFLKDDIKLIDQREIELKLRELEGVKDVVYKSKEEAYKKVQDTTSENEGLLQGYTLEHNPFPASFTVKLESPEYAENISQALDGFTGVEKIDNQKKVVDGIVKLVKGINIVGGALFIVLVGVSIFLIMNTTKLTVYSRRREVGIMKFVGATDWFIRWPFIIEGMVIGVLGSTLSCIVLFFAYKGVFSWIASMMMFVTLVPPIYILKVVLLEFIIGGILVGGIASASALRKFLIV